VNVDEIADRLVTAVGGADNIVSVVNCQTRVRFVLKDEAEADDDAARAIGAVKGVARRGGQYQVIIGAGVEDVRAAVDRALAQSAPSEPSAAVPTAQAPRQHWWNRALNVLSGTMVSLIPMLIGIGVILSVLAILNVAGVLATTDGTYVFFDGIARAGLYFLPVFVGYSAATRLNATPILGALVGASLLMPTLVGAISAKGGLHVFGVVLSNFNYASTVIPAFLGVVLLAYVERLVRRVIPRVLAAFLVPTISIVVAVTATYFILGPLGSLITTGLAQGTQALQAVAGPVAVGVIAALLPFLVMTGMHVGLSAVMLTLIASLGFDPLLLPAFLAYNMAVAGASLAMGLRSKSVEGRQVGFTAGVSALLGITEPGLFGVLLIQRRVLILTSAASLVAGLVCGFLGYHAYALIGQSLLSLPTSVDKGTNLISAVIVLVLAIGLSFVLNLLFGVPRGRASALDSAQVAAAVDDVAAPAAS
jgi:beta-glucoside PTS system EIICBA component